MSVLSSSRIRLIALIFAWTFGILTLLSVVTAGIAVVTLTGQTGRDLVVRLAEGRQVAGYGRLSLSGLEGNLFDRLTARRITLSDEDGVWLELEDAVFEWTPASLLANRLDIAELSVQRANVLRLPVHEEQPPGGGLPDLGVNLQRFEINALSLAEGVAGQPALIAVLGRAQGQGTRWNAQLDADRIDSPGDRVALSLITDGDITLRADIDAEPGGPLASLLQADAYGATARLSVDGTPDTGGGDMVLFIGDRRAGTSTLAWSGGRLGATGQFSARAWENFEHIDALIGGDIEFAIEIPLGEAGVTAPQLDAVSGEIRAPRLSLTAARQGEGIAVQVREAAGLVNALLPETTQVSSLAADGILVPASGDSPLSFEGRIGAEGITLPIGTIARATGPVRVEGPLDTIRITSALQTRGSALEPDIVQTLAGAEPSLQAELVWNNEARQLDIISAQLDGASGLVLAGSGEVDVARERIALSARYDGLAIERLTEQLSGRASGTAEVTLGFDGSGQLAATGRAQNLGRDLGSRIGGEARFSARAERRADGALALEALDIEAPNLVAEAQGHTDEQGWDMAGQAAWSGGAPLAAMVLEGTASLAFEASDRDDTLRIRADIAAPRAGAGPVVVSDARLRLEGEGPPDAFDGAWRLTGNAGTGPVDIGGRASRQGERADLSGIEGRFGAFNFTGGLQAEGSRMGGALRAVPVNGFGSAAIAFRLADGHLRARIRAEDMVGENLTYLDRLEFDADGPVEDIAFTLEAEGAYGARALVSMDGRVVSGDAGGELGFSLIGRYGGVRVATREPASIRFGPDGTQARLAFGLNRGTLDALLNTGSDGMEITLDAVNIPAMLLSHPSGREPVGGTLSGNVALSQTGGAWTGNIRLEAANISPPPDQQPEGIDIAINASLSMLLDAAGARLEARARGSNLEASADVQLLSGPVTGPESFTAPDTGIQGRANVTGEIGTLAAFRLGEGQSLSGSARLNAVLAGSVGAPDLDGSLVLENGRFDDPAIGISVRDLRLDARFAEDGLEIDTLRARSADGGELTGTGSFSLAGARLDGRAALDFSDFLIIERPDLTAVGGGNVTFAVSENRIEIGGETRLSRAEVRPPEASRPAIALVEVVHINAAGAREETAVHRAGPQIVLSYRIHAPGRIFVRGPQFDSEWSMDVTARGPIDDVQLRGRATLLRGRADLLGRPFEMRSGSVVFAGDPMEAAINLVAARQAREITAEIRVGGTVRAPEITLASTPSLPQDEIASRLLFDQGAGQLSGVQAAQLAGAVASMSTGGGFDPFGALRSGLGLDQLSVSTTRTGETVVSGGRYLTEDVYLELESGGGSAAATTRIEWALTQNLTLLSRIAPDGDTGVALTWRREYD
ncbi:translocation/assembly module TamB domain-containing protein [Glycocaulis sp.]|uniref:translocation/assembly module TamB domain-containing protein n=1 Tax=Glycocaulis sp. TaxID=1969725 RepID=UPI003D1AE073